jgi:DNA-binding NtrC family response regulator
MTLRAYLDQQEAAIIAHHLIAFDGDVVSVAHALGLPHRTLRFRMKRCGLITGDQRQLRSSERRSQLRTLEEAAKHYSPPR